MSVNVKNLHPNWKVLYANHMAQLAQMVKDGHSQSVEASHLLAKYKAEVAEIEAALKEGK